MVSSSEGYEFEAYEGVEGDLPEISCAGDDDLYQRIELSLPFARTMINRFMEKVDIAEEASPNEGLVTFEALQAAGLSTPAWSGLGDPESNLHKLLLSNLFSHEAQHAFNPCCNANMLRVFGLLHCKGKPADKAKHFYWLLQEGQKK